MSDETKRDRVARPGETHVVWQSPMLDDPSGPGTLPIPTAHPITGDGTIEVSSVSATVPVDDVEGTSPPPAGEDELATFEVPPPSSPAPARPPAAVTHLIDGPARRWRAAARKASPPRVGAHDEVHQGRTRPLENRPPLSSRETWSLVAVVVLALTVMVSSYWCGYVSGLG